MFEREKCFPRSDTALVLVLKQRGLFFLLLGDFGGDSALVAVLSWLGKVPCLWGLSRCCLQGTASGQELLEAGSWHWQELSTGDSYQVLGDDSKKGFTQRRDFCFFF